MIALAEELTKDTDIQDRQNQEDEQERPDTETEAQEEAGLEDRPVKEYRIEDGILVEETPPPPEQPDRADRPEERPEDRSGDPEMPAPSETGKAGRRIAELERELAAARADFYNYRQRMARERQGLRRLGVEDTILSLIPVLDNLDRALSVPEDGSAKDVLVGVGMVQRQFLTILDELGVQVIPTRGELFDPSIHEAAGTEAVDDPEQDGRVLEELLRGYRTKERVLRVARVTVGRAE